MLLRRILALSLFAVSTTTLADAIDINLRDSSAQLRYGASMGRDTLGKSEIHLGFLYTNKNELLGELGILVKDEVGNGASGLSAGVGIKGLMTGTKGIDAKALALGGQVRFSPLSDTRFGIIGLVYLSPNIITFGDAERFIETGVRLDYEIIPQATAYLGYRKIKFGLKTGTDATLDEGIHVGARIMF